MDTVNHCKCCCKCCDLPAESRNIRRANEAEHDALMNRPHSMATIAAFFDVISDEDAFQQFVDRILAARARRDWAQLNEEARHE